METVQHIVQPSYNEIGYHQCRHTVYDQDRIYYYHVMAITRITCVSQHHR